jgi:anti-anti-sigma factor
MNIQVSYQQGRVPVTVLNITGKIESSNYEQLIQVAAQEIADGARYILLNLKDVQFISSAGLRAIMIIFKKLRALASEGSDVEMRTGITKGTYTSSTLKLCNPSKDVAEILRITGSDMLLEIHPDVDSAIASFA